MAEIVIETPRTGAPAYVSATLVPIVRRSVLLPAMFAPLTTNTGWSLSRLTSFATAFSPSSGWASPSALRTGPSSTTLGKLYSGCSKAKQLMDEYASNQPMASIHFGSRWACAARQRSRASAVWVW